MKKIWRIKLLKNDWQKPSGTEKVYINYVPINYVCNGRTYFNAILEKKIQFISL